jgi:hypothetical protein
VKTLAASNGATQDYFGSAVATNGTYVVAGAPYTDHNGKTNAGSLYVFGLQNNVWTQKIVLNATDPCDQGYYGASADLWQKRLVVGAPGAYVTIGNTNTFKSGAAYTYTNTDVAGFTWISGQKIITHQAHDDMHFAASVAIENNQLLCGAPRFSGQHGVSNGYHRGGGFQYIWENGNWKMGAIIGSTNDICRSGASVAVTNGVWLAGMPQWKGDRGRMVIQRNGAYPAYLYDEDPNVAYGFGSVVAAHNGQFLVTSPDNEPLGRVFFGVID